MKIGVLALQGAFQEHIKMLTQMEVDTAEVRLPADLHRLDGLIIPGGESTTIAKLAVIYDLMEPLREFAKTKAVWGTCAGMIFMAKDIGLDQPLLGVMDIVVERNAFGRQVDSFETGLDVAGLAESETPFPAIFIRAPRLVDSTADVEIISRLTDGTAVAARQGHWLVTSFHPELTGDNRLHRLFVDMALAQ
ncbi:MAG: pyridoxal 5'-phosphate synthase glutaminase subunit PdxT [Anaerolineae bacterium]